MKGRFRTQALERLYQRVLELQKQGLADYRQNNDVNPEERAEEFCAKMSGSTKVLLQQHVIDRHGQDAFEELMWVFPAFEGLLFSFAVQAEKVARY